MTIVTSGTISLGDIHVEAAGSPYAYSGTSSLNDTDIRGLVPASGKYINPTLGTTVSFSDFYGASKGELKTVTVGTYYDGTAYVPSTSWGYNQSQGYGSISNGTLGVAGNKTIQLLAWNDLNILTIRVAGTASNSGWTTMTVNGTAFSRSSASFLVGGTATTSWQWLSITTNPFGTTVGATKQVVFT
ncbi:hypothetical protein N9165_00370 [Akkermansiaceae bacterium]|nr:hypothetical protein [Akkermansiaceae bacterium]